MKKVLKTILLIGWLILIFYMSSQTGGESGSLSKEIATITGKLLNHLFSFDLQWFVETFEVVIRKIAHMTEYFILFVISCSTFKEYNIKHFDTLALLFTVLYATTDEIHQLYIPGRYGCLSDVLIDSTGAILAFLIWHLIKKWKIYYQERKR